MSQNFVSQYGPWAVVTGASSGIGEQFALRLAKQGLNLILVARRKPLLEDLARELMAEYGNQVVPVEADLSCPEGVETLAQAAQGKTVGLLVNNAGFGLYGPFLEQHPDRELAMVDLNCRTALDLTRRFLPAMVERDAGGVIFTSSVVGFQPIPYMSAYAASKAFLLVLAESLYGELNKTNVHVLALCPGYTETGFQKSAAMGRAFTSSKATPKQVVDTAMKSLGKKMTVIHGFSNAFLVWSNRFLPRRWAANISAWISRPR